MRAGFKLSGSHVRMGLASKSTSRMEFFTFAWVTDPGTWISLVTLAALEIVLGIDNLVFIALLSNRLPEQQRSIGRKLGLAFALVTRLLLLATLAWIVKLTQPVFSVFGQAFSWRDIILITGGLFLLYKATTEIGESVRGEHEEAIRDAGAGTITLRVAVIQIGIIDIIFSLDSVITAVGMADKLWVMVVAVVVAMIIMLVASDPLAKFVSEHPTVKMLALSFLLLIGVVLVADGFGLHIPKGYVYFALFFSIAVESLNHWMRKNHKRRIVPPGSR
jgi:predicted tellurium resistance membrane protein TerC